MKTNQKPSLDKIPLSKLNENVKIIISSDNKSPKENKNILNKIIEDDDTNIKVSIEIDKPILEMPENIIPTTKKKKLRKKNIDLINEEIEEIIKKNLATTSRRTETKNSEVKIGKKRKRLCKRKKDYDEDYTVSSDEDENKKDVNIYMSIHEKDNDDSTLKYEDDKELIEFMNQKRCNKQKLSIYKEIYDKKMKNKNKIEISFGDDSYNLNFNLINKENERNNNTYEKHVKEIKIHKHLKKLKKNTDNKEMELPLDTECIICCCIINELANPDGCNHNFCKSCLIEWSQRSGKCPMCKKIYNNIYIYEDGLKKQISLNEIKNKFKKEKKNNENVENIENIEKICYICGKTNDQNNILACDRCKNNFSHYYCIHLNKKPDGKWFCKYCQEELKVIRESKKKIGRFFL